MEVDTERFRRPGMEGVTASRRVGITGRRVNETGVATGWYLTASVRERGVEVREGRRRGIGIGAGAGRGIVRIEKETFSGMTGMLVV